jgi:pyrroloquinoline-quinone synthase
LNQSLGRTQFIDQLVQIGRDRYHNLHPFHKMLHLGECNKTQIQAWALNRYYYQRCIPIKDSLLLSKFELSSDRKHWRSRLDDHDGNGSTIGGLQRWLKLCESVGLEQSYVESLVGISPITRFAVDAYVNFVREKTLLESVASSLTEMFSPTIISERVSGMLKHYDFVDAETLSYFMPRLQQAPKDVEFALNFVCEHATTIELQKQVCKALEFKCDVLWSMCDGLYYSYVSPKFKSTGMF